jgi:hypothetical protein
MWRMGVRQATWVGLVLFAILAFWVMDKSKTVPRGGGERGAKTGDGGHLSQAKGAFESQEFKRVSVPPGTGAVSFLSWPSRSPLAREPIRIQGGDGIEENLVSDENGLLFLKAGAWLFSSGRNSWEATEKSIEVKEGTVLPILCFSLLSLTVTVKSDSGRFLPDIEVAWSPVAMINSPEDLNWGKTQYSGIANIPAKHQPGFLTLRNSNSRLSEIEFPGGFPGGQGVQVTLPDPNEFVIAVRLVDQGTGERILAGEIRAGREVAGADALGEISVPVRWGSEYSWIQVLADGYQPIQRRNDYGIPEEIELTRESAVTVEVVDAVGVPVAGAKLHPFQSFQLAQDFSPERPFLPSRLTTDQSGSITLPCEPGATIQLFCRTEDGLFGNLFIPSVEHGRTYAVVLKESEPLVLYMLGKNGIPVHLDPKDVKVRGVDKNPMPLAIDQEGGVFIAAPAYADWIQVSPPGEPSLILSRKTFGAGAMPYSWDDAGGRLPIPLAPYGGIQGEILNPTGSVARSTRFQLTSLDKAPLNKELEDWGDIHVGWEVQRSTISRIFTTDYEGRFHISNVPFGTWLVQRVGGNKRRIIGNGGDTDPIVSSPSKGYLRLVVPGATAVNLTVMDAISNFPIPSFTVRLRDDPFTNYSVGSSRGERGRWNGWVRDSVLNRIEVVASGYQVTAIDIPEEGTGVSTSIFMQPSEPGYLQLVGPGRNQLNGDIVEVVDLGEEGTAFFGQGRWQQRVLMSEDDIVPIAVPGGQTRLRIQFAYPGKRLVKFLPDTFDYTTGETVTIQVVPITDG